MFCLNQGKSDACAEWLRNQLKGLKRTPTGEYRIRINSRQSSVFICQLVNIHV